MVFINLETMDYKSIETRCKIYMETWQGKHFSITDTKEVNTVIYQINLSLIMCLQ